MSSLRARAEALTKEAKRRAERAPLEKSLYQFVKAAWPYIDTAPFQDSWALEAVCLHLEAVTRGDIRRLLINLPPRCGKSKIVSVAWNAWTWIQSEQSLTSGPGVNFLCASYNDKLSLELAADARKLMRSAWFQRLWGDRIKFSRFDDSKSSFSNLVGGSRRSTSVGGSLLGIGGGVLVGDDVHNTEGVESEADRETVKRWWSEFSTTRMNDPKRSALVVVMQRLHEEDVSGLIMSSPDFEDWVHLMLPMRHDADRHCITPFWEDPRTEDGELLWPERFGLREIGAMERELGPYLASGRLQQAPSPPKGGIIREDWWQLWEGKEGDSWPAFDFVLASADTAFTEREENDPTGFTVWGCFHDPMPKVVLIYAWRKRLKTKGEDVKQEDGETYAAWRKRAMPKWGLVELINDSCRRYKVNTLIIESKANGLVVAEELQRLHMQEGRHVITTTPEGDKTARAHAVVGLFSSGMVYAPDTEWADMVIQEARTFPKGRYKDLTDSTTQALSWLRTNGFLSYSKEIIADEKFRARHREPRVPLYPGCI